ncbi:MAG: restriction endonuclease [Erythrobacter sp.]|nr:restriction endonuclease [Erythrobacter sp.]
MGINLIVAVTDEDWFNLLRGQATLDEVNFWSPSPRSFHALRPGELFLFKLHAPKNFIVGGGVFAHADQLPCSLAWEAFGIKNGAESHKEMRDRIVKYRRAGVFEKHDFEIGCRILTQPFFLDKQSWIPVPEDWSPNIVSFKTYSTDDPTGMRLWESVQDGLFGRDQNRLQSPIQRYGEPTIVRPRLGQGGFRALVTDVYHRRCAITGEKTLPALDAAHIWSFSEGGPNEVANGLLLRKDVHSLFDAGYITVTDDLHVNVSSKIKEQFENGREYYAMHGRRIMLPDREEWRPDPVYLRMHNEEFLG